jgi:hypothetical protein
MLEKALDRLARRNWHGRSQYPEIVIETENTVSSVRAWIRNNRPFSFFMTFHILLNIFISELTYLINQLTETCRPAPGKKAVRKSRRLREQTNLCKDIDRMVGHMSEYLNFPENETLISIKLEQALVKSSEKHCLKKYEQLRQASVSRRGEKTYIFPWSEPEKYHELVTDKKRFRREVVDRLAGHRHATGHRPGCECQGKYRMCGFRRYPRKPVMPGGKKQEFRIRMVECSDCGQKFSLLPSFLPREKHFSIDIIGQILRGIVLFGQSVSGAFENIGMCGRRLKSRQTIYNWLRWAGTFHPATLLERAGAKCSGYFQEDEGFEKESALRTYTVVMVDPRSQTVWHMDYVDHVDEETLCASFEGFLREINFNVRGVAKDRWEPSTKALKSVFHRVWIGFCHLHCLKKFSKALSLYQRESECSVKEVSRLFRKFRKILDTSTHAASLKAKLKSLDDKAFEHPLLKERVDELRENAVRYTSHKKRNGITTTTSIADNFLKIIKRKLRQVGSFRDRECAKIFFKATANIRNFVPFMPGSKNAHKSPFMLAEGETYGLPWMQVMNMHNGFLFTPNAF